MKRNIYTALFASLALIVSSCADLGFGVDVGPDGSNPYWYGNGYLGSTYWNTPVWNYGPVYKPTPPRPPLVGNGPGSIGTPPPPQQPQRPPQQQPQQPPQQLNPGVNGGVPTQVGGIQRPGNGGMPTYTPAQLPQSAQGSTPNSRR